MPDSAPPWRSNTTVDELAAWLASCERVALLTHQKPDGDAIGATLALARALRSLGGGRRPTLVYAGPEPHWLPEIAAPDPYLLTERDGLPPDDFDAIAIVDTGSRSQLEPFLPLLDGAADRIAVIDHHLSGDPALAGRLLIEPAAAAVCETIAALCARLLNLAIAALPREVAEPLYLGIATDTGWLKYSNTTPRTLRLAADLMEAGVTPTDVYEHVEQRERPARIRLLGKALNSMRLHMDGRLAVLRITRQDIREVGAAPADTGGFSDLPMAIDSVQVVAVLTEIPGPSGTLLTKVSLRSKPGPDPLDVNRVAGALGGGGHARAAGARLPKSLDDVETAIIGALST
jgi:phosphoesterase RecJ-like protein